MGFIWGQSNGDWQLKQAIHDYATTGMGYLYCYVDPESDFGRGDVKFTYVNPFRVYVSPNTRNRWYDDAESVILSTILTGEQVTNLYPELAEQKNEETGEMEGYCWAPSKGAEVKDAPAPRQSDHAIDALRYICSKLARSTFAIG